MYVLNEASFGVFFFFSFRVESLGFSHTVRTAQVSTRPATKLKCFNMLEESSEPGWLSEEVKTGVSIIE